MPPRVHARKKAAKKKGARKKAAKKKMTRKARSPSAAGKAARAKGSRGELRVVKALKILWPDREDESGKVVEQVKRNYQDRGADRDGPDVETPALDGEVKHRVKTCLPLAIRDAIENTREGRPWFAVDYPTTGPRKTPVIAFDLDQFVEFIRRERVLANGKGFDQGYTEGLADAGIVNLDDERRRRAGEA